MDGDLLKIHWDLQSSYYLQGLTINYHSIGHPLTLVLFFLQGNSIHCLSKIIYFW